jgi:two-component system response regulator YesN
MYKLIIIDDKPNVIEGIRRFGNWAERGIEVVGSALNGQEALKLIETTQPDIAITDIAMPLLDGLAFTEQAHKILPRLRIIILSGYDQFEYARQALRLGVMDYLLKPVKIDQIVAAVERAKAALQAEENTAEELLAFRRQTQKSEWQHEIDGMLEQPERWVALCQTETETALNRLGLINWSPSLRLLLFTPPDLLDAIEQFWLQTPTQERLIVAKERYGLTLAEEIEASQLAEALNLQSLPNSHLILGQPASHPTQLPQLYAALVDTFKLVEFNQTELTGALLSSEQLVPAPVVYPVAVEREIIQCLRIGLAEEVTGLIKKFYQEARVVGLLDPVEARDIGMRLLTECGRMLTREGYESQLPPLYGLYPEEGRSLAELEARVSHLIIEQVSQIATQRQAKNKSAVERATEFIQANLHREISLDDVAGELHFTSSYLANLFKKATGETVVEYISRLKMERAAELVCDPDIKIGTIAQTLGYNDRRYFSELFRRKFGCTPSEYRERFWLGRRQR